MKKPVPLLFSWSRSQLLAPLAILAGMLLTACSESPTPDAAPSTTAPSTSPEKGPPSEFISTPLTIPDETPGKLFESVPIEVAGLKPWTAPAETADHPLNHLYGSGFEAGGVAIGDVDNDGRADLYFASSPGRNRLYRQIGDFEFEDITEAAGVDGGMTWGRGPTFVDIDNDGDLDLYVANYGADNLLYINEGATDKGGITRFTESASSYGLNVNDASLTPTFCDYDRDGDLDMYLLTNQFQWPGPGSPQNMFVIREGVPTIKPEFEKYFIITSAANGRISWEHAGRRDYLFENNGQGHFTDVSEKAGISDKRGRGLSATWWDYDHDGWLDLYVGNDWEDPDHLYRNQGDGTFQDVIRETVPHSSWASMGADIGDLNNDGLMDLISADMDGTTHYKRKISMGSMNAVKNDFLQNARPPQYMRNAVYLSTGTDRVFEAAYLMGLASSDWAWSIKLRDFDCDGRCDVFLTNGMVENITTTENEGLGQEDTENDPRKEHNLAFRNEGDYHFSKVGPEWGLDHKGLSLASACGDLDGDGDLDLIVVNQNEAPLLYRNHASENRCAIRLKGTESNHFGLGSLVTVETPTSRQIHEILLSRGYLGSDDPVLSIGLGSEKIISKLIIQWPTGRQSVYENLSANRHYTMTEPEDAVPTPTEKKRPTLFVKNTEVKLNPHRETPFDDFARESLLPNKLSQLGPALSVADFNGDGLDDLTQGSGRGQPTLITDGRSLTAGTSGQPTASMAINGSQVHEDMGLLWFDADGDRDLDLYVVSGGVECQAGDPVLQDRLYINGPGGRLSLAPTGTLPPMPDSGGPVTASDFDRDGDLDLFIGGRVVPGAYSRTQLILIGRLFGCSSLIGRLFGLLNLIGRS
ncbi:MAG: VCBS repeat-containing protein, partial [Verrucomicrobiota bacterium]